MEGSVMDPKLSACIRSGVTSAPDPWDAARELKAALDQPNPSLVLVFVSPDRDFPAVSRALTETFGPIPVVGCTTAGEITPAGYRRGSIVGISLASPGFVAVAERIDNLHTFHMARGNDLVQRALRRLDREAPGSSRDRTFAMLLIDGLSGCEEAVVSALHDALGGIPLFGGSAGDTLQFRRTCVLHDGVFHQDSAVLLLVSTSLPFRVFKTEHFVSSEEKMVVTEADPVNRIVTEINGEPAAREYARVVGLNIDELTPTIFAAHPVVVRIGGSYFVRSIQKVNPDHSLTFFCAIDQGIVLTVARGIDLVENLERLFGDLRNDIGPPELVIGCECVLRNLEQEQKGLTDRVGRLMVDNKVVGFSTYGEQYLAMHVNQTFTGVAIGRRAVR